MDSLNEAMAAPALTRLFLVRVYLVFEPRAPLRGHCGIPGAADGRQAVARKCLHALAD